MIKGPQDFGEEEKPPSEAVEDHESPKDRTLFAVEILTRLKIELTSLNSREDNELPTDEALRSAPVNEIETGLFDFDQLLIVQQLVLKNYDPRADSLFERLINLLINIAGRGSIRASLKRLQGEPMVEIVQLKHFLRTCILCSEFYILVDEINSLLQSSGKDECKV